MKKDLCKYFLPVALIVGLTGGVVGFQASQVFSSPDNFSDTQLPSLSKEKDKTLLSDGKDDIPRRPLPWPRPII